jgi:uncharacterized OB-fold protein
VTEYRKPLPDVDNPATAQFWRGSRASTLLVQQCVDCGYLRWPPGPICPECLVPEFTWASVHPHGTLVTYCVYHKAFSASFAEDVPYAVAYVQLDDGPRMYGTLIGDLDSVECGAPVDAVFVPATPEVTLVQWTASNA